MTSPDADRSPRPRRPSRPRRPRRSGRLVATCAAVAAVITGCGAAESGTTPASSTTSPSSTASGGFAEVPIEEVLELGGLTLPPDARAVSSLRRANADGLRSFLAQIEATPVAARALCSQVSGPLLVGSTGLSQVELDTFELAAAPAGKLEVCSASLAGTRVERRTLVATTEGTAQATAWLAVYEAPAR